MTRWCHKTPRRCILASGFFRHNACRCHPHEIMTILLIRLTHLYFELNALCKMNPTYHLYYPGFYYGSVTTIIRHIVISGWCVSTWEHLKASHKTSVLQFPETIILCQHVHHFPYYTFTWSITCYPWVHILLLAVTELPTHLTSLPSPYHVPNSKHNIDLIQHTTVFTVICHCPLCQFKYCGPRLFIMCGSISVSLNSDFLGSHYRGSILGDFMWVSG